ncbi:MAG TPA: hypothetical protein VNT22_04955 [Baekduia sp.]|nr:hypothetical protein [Baekduia sp.]
MEAGSTETRSAQRSRTGERLHRLTTETKHSSKTTELYAMVVVVLGILISAAVIKGGDDGTDQFIAKDAWLYVSIVAAAYLISRGLAKSGSREPYTVDSGDGGTRDR